MIIVQIKDKNINRALKELKTKFIKTKVVKELNNRKNFKKKSVERREEVMKAIYKEKKNNNLDN
jgi:small subunit ribosomal protein S21